MWELEVHGTKSKKTLALVAPHGTFPVAKLTPAVQKLVDKLPLGVELRCEGKGFNISTVVVQQILGPVSVLEPHILSLPDAWVHEDGELALARARARMAKKDDATGDLLVALRYEIAGLEADFARLSDRDRKVVEDAYAEWSRHGKATPEILGKLPISKWSDEQLIEGTKWAVSRAGNFGKLAAEDLLGELGRRGVDTKVLTKKLKAIRKSAAAPAAPSACVRIDAPLENAKVIGGSSEVIWVSAIELVKTSTTHGARTVRDPAIPLTVAFDREGNELRRTKTAFTHVMRDYALNVDRGQTSYVARLDDFEILVRYDKGIRAFDDQIVWGILEQKYDPSFQMRSEVRTLDGKVLLKLWPDDIHDVRWDDEHLYVTRSLEDEEDEEDEKPDAMLDRYSRATRKLLDSKPTHKYGRDESEGSVAVVTRAGVETAPVAPWRFGFWTHEDLLGFELRWLRKQLFVSARPPAGKLREWVAVALDRAPTSIDLAPPWLALHSKAGIVAIRLDELLTQNEIRLDGKVIAKRADALERPKPAPKLVEWFELLVEHGILPAMGAIERDKLLLSEFGAAAAPSKTSLAKIVADRSPLSVSHDTHWFTKDDRVIARFDAPLANEPVRFKEKALEEGSVTIVATTSKGDESITCEPLVWDVAEILDARLRQHKSKKRVYALKSSREDFFVYLLLTSAERTALLKAGITGIEKDATTR